MRLTHAWREMRPEQRLAALASVGLLVTMFFPWYGLQSLNGKTINSHSINAFGDVSFVEAAVFLVAAGVVAMVLARVDGREFHLPGGDGTIVMIAGGWAALLIFYRVFDRPAGHGYPVGIEWGFFLAFVAAGSLAYAGWRMRTAERPEAPLRRAAEAPGDRATWPEDPPAERRRPRQEVPPPAPSSGEEPTVITGAQRRPARTQPAAARSPRYPPPPTASPNRPRTRGEESARRRITDTGAEQLSFEDAPTEQRSGSD
ncbi:MAG TPA: hypothetical protein VGG98_08335 [Solirubrobacteraceae bacterium]|jgi:hypothetical protein